jgi:excinuclease ABC subunit B
MRAAIGETDRRRTKQEAFNLANGIVPRGVHKGVRDLIDGVYEPARAAHSAEPDYHTMGEKQVAKEIKRLEKLMFEHAKNLEFEKAAQVRDQLALLREQVFGASGAKVVSLANERAA